jgi:hypothetical protein
MALRWVIDDAHNKTKSGIKITNPAGKRSKELKEGQRTWHCPNVASGKIEATLSEALLTGEPFDQLVDGNRENQQKAGDDQANFVFHAH